MKEIRIRRFRYQLLPLVPPSVTDRHSKIKHKATTHLGGTQSFFHECVYPLLLEKRKDAGHPQMTEIPWHPVTIAVEDDATTTFAMGSFPLLPPKRKGMPANEDEEGMSIQTSNSNELQNRTKAKPPK
jgi:hypothetical protein